MLKYGRIAGLAFLAACLAAPVEAEAFPNRPGKKTLERVCGTCHGLQLMAALRRNRAAWQASVDDMVTKGMQADDRELEEIVSYLAKYLSRLNVNKASPADLADVLDLPPSDAAALAEYRTKVGGFKDFEALVKAPGIDTKKLSGQRDRISFTGL